MAEPSKALPEKRRIFIGGLTKDISENDLRERFSSFGEVRDVEMARDQPDGAGPRGFAHLTLDCQTAQWHRLQSTYQGALWKGSRLKIEPAKPSPLQKLGAEKDSLPDGGDRKRTSSRKPLVRHGKDMSLMRNELVDKRRGWKRARYGRVVALMHVRNPQGQIITVDPDHYRNRIEKLFGSGRPRNISELTWFYPQEPEMTATDDNSSSDDDAKVVDISPMLISNSTESQTHLTDQVQKTPAKAAGFSLVKLLGLEPEINLMEEKMPVEEEPVDLFSTALPKKKNPPLESILFDLDRFDQMPLAGYAFCCRSGREEAYILWKEQRRDLRADFKQHIKQATKLARRQTKVQSEDHHHRHHRRRTVT